jgi:GNAT superfamily N-acetyltransferase
LKFFRMFKDISISLVKGEFSYAFDKISRRCPNWLFRYSKALLMVTERFIYPDNINPEIKVKVAGAEDIDDIERISGINRQCINDMLNSGITCFLGSLGNDDPVSIAWHASGKCLIRGMGLYYDFGEDGAYGFGAVTLPEARKKGLHTALMDAKARYALEHAAKRIYSLVEYNNPTSLAIRIKTGFRPIAIASFIRIWPLNYSVHCDLESGKRFRRLFLRNNEKGVKVI